jgi:transcriptional regulator with XRE-family HTH domain
LLTEYLNALKTQKNLSWQELADLSEIPAATARSIFSGATQNPGIIPVAALVKAMGGSLDEALDLVPSKPEYQSIEQLHAIYDERISCIKTEHREAMDTLTRFYDSRIAECTQREEKAHQRQQRMLYFILSITGVLILAVLILAIDLLQGGQLI